MDTAGNYHLVSETHIVELALKTLESQFKRGDELFTTPAISKDFFSLKLASKKSEVFACVFLDNKHRLLAYEELFFGTIDGASVYPREVVRKALEHNAAAVILAHNHPSGSPEPSRADEQITNRLKEALALIDVRVLDHMIVGETVTSFAERGLL
jgi:DNA repair protein RadC